MISGDVDRMPLLFIRKKDSDVNSIQDSAAKRVAYTSHGGLTERSLKYSVSQADGISLDEVKFVEGGGLSEALSLLQEGDVELGPHYVPVYDFGKAGKENYPYKLVWNTAEYVDLYHGGIHATSLDFIENTRRCSGRCCGHTGQRRTSWRTTQPRRPLSLRMSTPRARSRPNSSNRACGALPICGAPATSSV